MGIMPLSDRQENSSWTQATSMDKIKTGTTLCKAIMRNGYDAYAINAPLQG